MDELSESEMEENWTDTTCAAPTDNVPSGTGEFCENRKGTVGVLGYLS